MSPWANECSGDGWKRVSWRSTPGSPPRKEHLKAGSLHPSWRIGPWMDYNGCWRNASRTHPKDKGSPESTWSAMSLRTFWLSTSYSNPYEPLPTTFRRAWGFDHDPVSAADPRSRSAATPPASQSPTAPGSPNLRGLGPAGPPGAGDLGSGPTLGLDPLPPAHPRPWRAARTQGHRSPVVDRPLALRDHRRRRLRSPVGPALHRERPLQVALRRGLAQLSHPQRFPGRPRRGPGRPLDPDDRRLDPGPDRVAGADRSGWYAPPRQRRRQQLRGERNSGEALGGSPGASGGGQAIGRGSDPVGAAEGGASARGSRTPRAAGASAGGTEEGGTGQGPAEGQADEGSPGAGLVHRPRGAVHADAGWGNAPGVQPGTGDRLRQPRHRRGGDDQRGQRRGPGRADAGSGGGAGRRSR